MGSPATSLPLDIEDLLSLDSEPLSGPDTPSPPVVTSAPAIASGALISEGELAHLLDLTDRRVRDLAKSGVISRVGRGPSAFDRSEAVRSYCRWIRDKAQRGVAVNDELKAEKIRQAREAADKLAIQNAVSRGEMVAASAVEFVWSNVLREVRSMLLAVPSRCGASLPHLTTHDVRAIDGEIKSALRGLADDDA